MKRCSHCKEEKSIKSFHKNKRFPDGRHYNCSDCSNEQGRRSKYKERYGITEEQKIEMLESQGSSCFICWEKIENFSDAKVDHDHQTGKIRKILCNNCNAGIGFFKDKADLLLMAGTYLRLFENKE